MLLVWKSGRNVAEYCTSYTKELTCETSWREMAIMMAATFSSLGVIKWLPKIWEGETGICLYEASVVSFSIV